MKTNCSTSLNASLSFGQSGLLEKPKNLVCLKHHYRILVLGGAESTRQARTLLEDRHHLVTRHSYNDGILELDEGEFDMILADLTVTPTVNSGFEFFFLMLKVVSKGLRLAVIVNGEHQENIQAEFKKLSEVFINDHKVLFLSLPEEDVTRWDIALQRLVLCPDKVVSED